MATRRISARKIREILKLKWHDGLSNRQVDELQCFTEHCERLGAEGCSCGPLVAIGPRND